MNNRDPSDLTSLAQAIEALLTHYAPERDGTNNGDNHDDMPDEEADMDFEAALIDLGVMNPDEAIDEFVLDHEFRRVVIILTGEGTTFNVWADGTVTC